MFELAREHERTVEARAALVAEALVAHAELRGRVRGAPGVDHAREIPEVVRHRRDEREQLAVRALLARERDEPSLARELRLDEGRGALGDRGVGERERASEGAGHDAEPLALVPGEHLAVEGHVALRHRAHVPARGLLDAVDRGGEALAGQLGPRVLPDALVDVGGNERRHGREVRGEERDEVALGVLSLAPSLLELGRLLQDLDRGERRLERERPRRRVLHLVEEELRRDADGLSSGAAVLHRRKMSTNRGSARPRRSATGEGGAGRRSFL